MIAPRAPLDVLVVGPRRSGQAESLAEAWKTQHRDNLLSALAVLKSQGARVLVVGYEEIAGREAMVMEETRRIQEDAKVLVLYPPSHTDRVGDAVAAGADDALAEPCFPDALSRRVEALLEKNDAPTPEAASPHHLTMDWLQRREQIVQQINKAARYPRLLTTLLVANLRAISGAGRVSLMYHRPRAGELVLVETTGLPDSIARGTRVRLGGSIAGRVAEHARPVVVADITASEYAEDGHPDRYESPTFMAVPMVAEARVLGVVCLSEPASGRAFDGDDLAAVLPIVDTAAAVIRNARLIRRLREAAIVDRLTGRFNRRHFDRTLKSETDRSKRYGRPVSLLLADLDHFKVYNDSLGHPAGDAALRQFGGILLEVFRETDVVCRYGGDEFAVIMPETGHKAAEIAKGRLNQALAAASFKGSSCLPNGRFQASAGVATFPDEADSARDLIEAADQDLRRAKLARGTDRHGNEIG